MAPSNSERNKNRGRGKVLGPCISGQSWLCPEIGHHLVTAVGVVGVVLQAAVTRGARSEVPTVTTRHRSHHGSGTMLSTLAFAWERACMVIYGGWVFGNALNHPKKFLTLTYWTMCLYVMYFTIDKASPHATVLTPLLHGVAFTGSISVMVGYAVMAFFGAAHHGSWYAWEAAMSKLNNLPHRTFGEKLAANLFVHAWPVVAVAVDLWLSWEPLSNIYAQVAHRNAATGWAVSIWFSVGFFCFGQTWQKLTFKARGAGNGKNEGEGEGGDVDKKAGKNEVEGAPVGSQGDVVDRYQAPPSVRNWLGRSDDFLFSLLVKLSGTAVALFVNAWLLPRLFRTAGHCEIG
eukprot:CAMPEP_0119540066 /NCGR_PEP_ID=MMETSP1344-20130328/52050_1 /TAXON_ID=236787 /ORGANISM="Florenciella parvula, Strain CCMP2471" /LENGTH=345 /DNA_ID=CAMNT_0007583655 /DNA_START=43 /DNA_END=1081 /DNA_ORIENTATION=-